MEIKQFRAGIDNFSYLVISKEGKAALVDPGTNASEAMKAIGGLNLDLTCVIDTHHHADHTAENSRVKEIYKCDIICSEPEKKHIPEADKTVRDGEIMSLDEVELKFLVTPGHTKGCLCILVDDAALLTGDTLFIGDCGRTDLRGGDAREMFESMNRLKNLPDKLIIYPGHDYGPLPWDTMGNQKKTNKVLLADSFEAFSRIP